MTEIARAELAALSAEVAALRRRVRRHVRLAAAALAAGLAGGALLAPAPLQSQAQRIVAQQITLVDAAGRTRGTWTGDSGIILTDSQLRLANGANQRLLTLTTEKDEPTILFHDAKGGLRMWHEVAANGFTRMVVRDDQGADRLALGVDENRVPHLLLFDPAKTRRVLLNVADNEPTLYMYDPQGRNRLYIDVPKEFGGRIALRDAQPKDRLYLQVDNANVPGLILHDAAGKRRLLLNSEGDGAGGLLLFDSAGRKRLDASAQGDTPSLKLMDAGGAVTGALPR